MDNQPLTPPYSWGQPTYSDPQFPGSYMPPDILSNAQTNPDPQGQFWMADMLNTDMIEAGNPWSPEVMGASNASNPDMMGAGDASNPGMIDPGVGSRSSTLSTYPESSTFNGDNSAFAHPYSSDFIPNVPTFPEPAYTCTTNYSRRTGYINEEGEESYIEPETGGLECPQEGCEARLKRFPEVKRHLKEQHQCAHPNCKDEIFRGRFERDKHEDEAHPDDVLGFKCGSCELKGTPKRFVRVEKLKGHFKSVHRSPGDDVFRGFQCEETSCLPVSHDGGIFFASRAHLEQHTQSKHTDKSKDESGMSTRNVAIVPRSREVSRISASSTKHQLSKEPVPRSKRSRVPGPRDSLSASRPLSGQFERILAEPIKILDICNFIEDPRFPRVVEELKLIHVWTVFIRSIRAIKICGAQSPDDMDRAIDLLNPLLPAKNTKLPSSSPRGLQKRSRPKDIPSISTQSSQSLPIRSSEDKEALHTWKAYVGPEVSKLIQDLPVGDSCSVTLVRQKGSLGHFEPVIRFHSPSQKETARHIIRKKIRETCSKNNRPELPIQFSNGRIVLLVGGASQQTFQDDPSDDRGIPHERRYFQRPGMGISIGMTQCAHEFATLGGYILVGNTQLMLTVQHLERKARDCVPCYSTGILDNSLSSPAPADIDDLKQYFEEELSNVGITMETSESVADEVLITTLATTYPAEFALMNQLKGFLKHLCKPRKDYNFGNVVDHSNEIDYVRPDHVRGGCDNITRHRMDWAIYEVDKERMGKNKFAHPIGIVPSPRHIQNEITNPYGTGEACQEWREFRVGENVYYVGNRSGYREGTIDETYIVIKHEEEVSQEWFINPSTLVRDEGEVQGDSGAWVLGKEDNKLLGLIWGYCDQKIVFTPIREVFNEISRKRSGDYVQVAPLDPGSAIRPRICSSISGTKRNRYRPKKSLFSALLPIQPSIEIPTDSKSPTRPSTPDHALSRSPSPTPSLMSSSSSLSESPSPSIRPIKLRSSGPYDLSDPFEKLDLASRPRLMQANLLLDGIDYPAGAFSAEIDEYTRMVENRSTSA